MPFKDMFDRVSPPFGNEASIANMLQTPGLQAILQKYGLDGQQQVNPYFMFRPDGFAGRHPRIAGGIENALLAAASMGAPGATVGENISNVARSIFAVPQMRRQHMIDQMMAPLQMAGMTQDLMGKDAQMQEALAHAEYYKGRAQIERKESAIPWHGVQMTPQGPYGFDSAGTYKKIPVEGAAPDWHVPGEHPGGYLGNLIDTMIPDGTAITDPKTGQARPATKEEIAKMRLNAYGMVAGLQTGSRIASTPGFISDQERQEHGDRMVVLRSEYEQLSDPAGRIMWQIAHGDTTGQLAGQRFQEIQNELMGGPQPPAPSPAPSKRKDKAAPAPAPAASPAKSVLGGLVEEVQRGQQAPKKPAKKNKTFLNGLMGLFSTNPETL